MCKSSSVQQQCTPSQIRVLLTKRRSVWGSPRRRPSSQSVGDPRFMYYIYKCNKCTPTWLVSAVMNKIVWAGLVLRMITPDGAFFHGIAWEPESRTLVHRQLNSIDIKFPQIQIQIQIIQIQIQVQMQIQIYRCDQSRPGRSNHWESTACALAQFRQRGTWRPKRKMLLRNI